MKWMGLLLLVAGISISALSEESSKPFDRMSYVELQQIDPASLSKEQRRNFKKALKKAKKRYDKERKRQKAAQEEMQQNEDDMHQVMQRSYRMTYVGITKDSEKKVAVSRVVPIRDYALLGTQGKLSYSIQSTLNSGPNSVQSSLHVVTTASEAVENPSLTFMGGARTATRSTKKQWSNYSLKYYRREEEMALSEIRAEIVNNQLKTGLVEELAIPIDVAELMAPLKVGSGLHLTLHSNLSGDKELQFPFAYLVGYLAKLSEEGFLSEKDQAFVGKLKGAIDNLARD